MCKVLSILLFSLGVVTAVLLVKDKPAYEVTFAGENLGYVNSKKDIENAIEEYESSKEGCIADINITQRPEYSFKFVDNTMQTNEEEVLLKVKNSSIITYRMFAIKLNGETKEYVESLEKAENVVSSIKEEYENEIDVDLTIEEIYTEETIDVVEIETAKAEIGLELDNKLQEKKEVEEAAQLAIKTYTSRGTSVSRISKEVVNLGSVTLIEPVSGTISSKFGSISSVRPSVHKGLDIAAPKGTPIKAAATGIVTFAGTDGLYGKFIIITHADGVETCYAHCSALYVSVGDEVKQGDIIAAVGSTGNSTGNHLHLEIRKDGVALNPQHYLYK